VQAPGPRIDQRRQRIHVGALQLRELPVYQHFAHDLVIGREILQHVRGGRNDFALAVFDRRGQSQVFE
jgi:hypothetical protein